MPHHQPTTRVEGSPYINCELAIDHNKVALAASPTRPRSKGTQPSKELDEKTNTGKLAHAESKHTAFPRPSHADTRNTALAASFIACSHETESRTPRRVAFPPAAETAAHRRTCSTTPSALAVPQAPPP